MITGEGGAGRVLPFVLWADEVAVEDSGRWKERCTEDGPRKYGAGGDDRCGGREWP